MAFEWFLVLGFISSTFAGQVCKHGGQRFFGPSVFKEVREEGDLVTSSIRLKKVNGGEADPKALLASGKLTVDPEDWKAAGNHASFVFKIYRVNDEISAVTRFSVTVGPPQQDFSLSISEDGVLWEKIKTFSDSVDLHLGNTGCREFCNGRAGRYVKLEVKGETVPVIGGVSIMVCQAFKDALSPTTLKTCKFSRPEFTDIKLYTNVKLKTGSFSVFLDLFDTLTFDPEDWEAKKGDAYLEYAFSRKVLLWSITLTTTGVKYATLFAKDKEGDEYVKCARSEILPSPFVTGIHISFTGTLGLMHPHCTGLAGRYFKLQLHGEEGAVPTISHNHFGVIEPKVV